MLYLNFLEITVGLVIKGSSFCKTFEIILSSYYYYLAQNDSMTLGTNNQTNDFEDFPVQTFPGWQCPNTSTVGQLCSTPLYLCFPRLEVEEEELPALGTASPYSLTFVFHNCLISLATSNFCCLLKSCCVVIICAMKLSHLAELVIACPVAGEDAESEMCGISFFYCINCSPRGRQGSLEPLKSKPWGYHSINYFFIISFSSVAISLTASGNCI